MIQNFTCCQVTMKLSNERGCVDRQPHILGELTEQAAEDFDPVYMAKLFTHAYEAAKNGYAWRTAPPGFAAN